MTILKVVQTDITRLKVDVIVNAANSSLLGGGGVDGAIHRAAGPELLAECRALRGCRTGQAKTTRAYRLPAKHVIHTVGPVWRNGQHNEAALLASCYRHCMLEAGRLRAASIAFPAISCGVYQFPAAEAASIAIATIGGLMHELTSLQTVFLVCFDDVVLTAYQKAITKYEVK